MFRRSRRTPGRHTEAYLSRRARAAAETAAVSPAEGDAPINVPVGAPIDAPIDALVPSGEPAETDPDGDLAPTATSRHAHGDVLCGRCETLLAGDELNALRAKRAAGAA